MYQKEKTLWCEGGAGEEFHTSVTEKRLESRTSINLQQTEGKVYMRQTSCKNSYK